MPVAHYSFYFSRRWQSREYGHHPPLCDSVYDSVILSIRTIKQKRLKLKSPNLSQG